MSSQLIKETTNGIEKVFPKTYTESITDKRTGKKLIEILNNFNMYFLSYTGNTAQTRCLVPKDLRREGLWITYVTFDHTVVTEWYNSNNIDDDSWKLDTYWRRGSNKLVGDISISTNGKWVIDGKETEFDATGDPIKPILRVSPANKLQVTYDDGKHYEYLGDNPVYTTFRTANNKLQISTDLGKTWTDTSEYIAAWFRWTDADNRGSLGKIQISRDNSTWEDMTPNFSNNLYIKGYVTTVGQLPTSTAALGDIYMVGPTYDASDTNHDYPHYRMWVKQSSGWVDNGEYQSNILVSQEFGTEAGTVISQKFITEWVNKGYQFRGVATPTINPGTPNGPVFYLTTTSGVYSNFGGLEVLDGEAVIFEWDNSTWSKRVTGFTTQEKLTELEGNVSEVIALRCKLFDGFLSEGNVIDNANFKHTSLIDIRNSEVKFYNNITSSFPGVQIAYYNSDKNYLSSESQRLYQSDMIVTLNAPNNACFAAINVYVAGIGKFFVSVDNTNYIAELTESVSSHEQTISIYGKPEMSNNLFDKSGILENTGVNGSSGHTMNDTLSIQGINLSPIIAVEPSEVYKGNSRFIGSGACRIYGYTESGYYAGGIDGVDNGDGTFTYTLYSNMSYIRFEYSPVILNADTFMFCKGSIPESYQPYGYVLGDGVIKDIDDRLTSVEREINNTSVNYDGKEICTFRKMICIGDSITEGTFNHNESGTMEYMSRDNSPYAELYSYPSYLHKLTGIDITNKGRGGYTSKRWYEVNYNLDFSSYDSAIIMLGINDVLQGMSTQDSVSYLSQIISVLKNGSNGIKIFLATLTPAYTDGNTLFDSINAAIRNLASTTENVYLIDINKYSKCHRDTAYEYGHLSAIGYYQMAKEFVSLISYVMKENLDDFGSIQFIGTTYSYNRQ